MVSHCNSISELLEDFRKFRSWNEFNYIIKTDDEMQRGNGKGKKNKKGKKPPQKPAPSQAPQVSFFTDFEFS